MKADMASGGSGVGKCEGTHGDSTASIFYYTPLNENVYEPQWYMVAIVPENVLSQRMNPVIHQVQILAVSMLIIAILEVGIFAQVERKRREELASLAYEDSLTGGYNFACFRENVKIRKGLPGYVIALDLADFKLINSFFGVQKGDETLMEVWKILLGSISESEMVARVNADRFVLFLQAEAREVLESRIQDWIKQIGDISVRLNIPSLFPVFGIYYTDALDKPDECYGYAVQAKHLVKGRRDRHYAFYDEVDAGQIMESRKLENAFEEALAQEQFEVWYQPKYSAQEEKVIGAEALVRWRKPDGSLLSPGVFIPLFEKNGNIAVLDEYIFRKVCEQQKAWLEEGRSVVPVSVNISRVSLYFANIVERYQKILQSYDLDARYVQLEITESATVDNTEIADLIERFHNAGFDMLLDDFGSGYSSLASLNTLRFDILKLDKSLVDYIGDENGEKLLEHITKLGQSLGLHITAEGVETERQLIFLRNLHCDDIQGYYFSKPLPLAEYEKLM
jgi:EAL domain-containing protein (putative c-di-GMP-specific phosphodiesterase class I)/GGDEF domain-containing protein